MVILGTGLSGLVGSRIVELLADEHQFIDLSLETGIDITQKKSLEEAFNRRPSPPLVLHLAAFTDVNAAWEQQGNQNGPCYRINVIGTKNIADLCARYHQYLIHVSTDFVFDGQQVGQYSELDQPRPIEWYGQTKFLAEEEVKNSGCRFCLVRIAFPFRAKFDQKSDSVRKLIDGFKKRTLYPLFADQIITPTFIDDIAAGLKAIIDQQPEGIYHLVGSTSLSPYELGLKVARTFGFEQNLVKKGSLEDYLKSHPASRPYQKNLALANKKARKLGIKMKTIDESLSSLKSQLSLSPPVLNSAHLKR